MTEKEIILLAKGLNGKVQETHISWVILTEEYAFKIKKPLKFSFLDFSSLNKRVHYCQEEFRLNSRLTSIYCGLVYLESNGSHFEFHSEKVEGVIEVAVKMKRLNDEDRMDRRIEQNSVGNSEISALAEKIAGFHKRADVLSSFDDLLFVEKRFKDVLQVGDWIEENLGKSSRKVLENSINYHDRFLQLHSSVFKDRVVRKYKRDVHGDLHTQNIFLSIQPIIFDCIEFNSLYREIDVLNEVAFLCMDLEVRDREDLSNTFLTQYLKRFNCIENDLDLALFQYYKTYRANVKVKVTGLRAIQDESKNKENYKETITRYVAILNQFHETKLIK